MATLKRQSFIPATLVLGVTSQEGQGPTKQTLLLLPPSSSPFTAEEPPLFLISGHSASCLWIRIPLSTFSIISLTFLAYKFSLTCCPPGNFQGQSPPLTENKSTDPVFCTYCPPQHLRRPDRPSQDAVAFHTAPSFRGSCLPSGSLIPPGSPSEGIANTHQISDSYLP